MNRPSDHRKLITNGLAKNLASEDGMRILRSLAYLNSADPGGPGMRTYISSPPLPESGTGIPDRIGIWKATEENGRTVYLRDGAADSAHFWSTTERIEPKGRKPRVVFTGESVARGFFYDPYFNPADALRIILRQALGKEDVEVIDLARIDLNIEALLNICRASLILDPDVLVVFAGNNWHPFSRKDLADFQEVGAVLLQAGKWSAVYEYVKWRIEALAEEILKEFERISKASGVPIIFVLPEYNLLDWRSEYSDCPPLLNDEDCAHWQHLKREADAAFVRRETAQAEKLAKEMSRLDEGTVSTVYELQARCRLLSGDLESARRLLEQSRDASLSLPVITSPRCYGSIQELFRAQAAGRGLVLVDLPERFADYLSGQLPGRRLFHDYCHLTVEGIRVAMSYTAAAVLEALGHPGKPCSDLLETDIPVSEEVEAEAYFLSAYHNANWGQPYELVYYQLCNAFERSSEVVAAARLFLDFYLRRNPSILCDSFHQLNRINTRSIAHYFLTRETPQREKTLNFVLIRALTDSLKNVGISVEQDVDAILQREHGLRRGEVNLLRKTYFSNSIAELETLWTDLGSCYKAYKPCSNFHLICSEANPIELNLTYRAPHAKDKESCVFEINGNQIAKAPIGRSWRTEVLRVDPKMLIEGLNSIIIYWPDPQRSWDDRLNVTARSLEMGIVPDVYSVYGELFSFRAVSRRGLSAAESASPQ